MNVRMSPTSKVGAVGLALWLACFGLIGSACQRAEEAGGFPEEAAEEAAEEAMEEAAEAAEEMMEEGEEAAEETMEEGEEAAEEMMGEGEGDEAGGFPP